MTSNYKLNLDLSGKLVPKKIYRGMIRSLVYLTTSKHDIMFSICLYARAFKEYHLKTLKRTFKYLFNSLNIFLEEGSCSVYLRDNNLELIGCFDANYATVSYTHLTLPTKRIV